KPQTPGRTSDAVANAWSIVGSLPMVSEQPQLSRTASRHHVGVEPPVQIWPKMLRHFPPAVVDLQKVANLVRRPVVATAVPEVTAEEQHVPGVAEYGLRQAAAPMQIGLARATPGPVTSRDDVRW